MMNGKKFVVIMVIVLLVISAGALYIANLINSGLGHPDNI